MMNSDYLHPGPICVRVLHTDYGVVVPAPIVRGRVIQLYCDSRQVWNFRDAHLAGPGGGMRMICDVDNVIITFYDFITTDDDRVR